MSNKIYWGFTDLEISHISTEETFKKDVLKMAKVLGIPSDSKITIHNGNDNTTTANATDSVSATPRPKFVAVSDSPKFSKNGKTSAKLCDVYGNLGGTDTTDNSVSPTDNSVADSSASDWLDVQ
jgi:hypothetical protein